MEIRSFIAINLSKTVYEELGCAIEDLKKNGVLNIRWSSPKNIHITLKFLGNIDTNKVGPISKRLQYIASHFSPFHIDIAGLGAFPRMENPRTLWIGIKAPDSLFSLQKDIEFELSKMGFETEGRAFTPHLTLGRVSKNATRNDVRSIADKIKQWKPIDIGRMPVDEMHLYRSDLLPEGSQYTILASFPLIG